MSPSLPQVKAKDVVRVARKLGFELDRQKGSHAIFYRSSDKARIVIPMHAGRDIKPKISWVLSTTCKLHPNNLRNFYSQE
jgi:predicted RNA binding protein YcfA (HicA-like mRNA interferase family)